MLSRREIAPVMMATSLGRSMMVFERWFLRDYILLILEDGRGSSIGVAHPHP
jgi:hypothetical protein